MDGADARVEVEVPQYAIEVLYNEEKKPYAYSLDIRVSGAQHQFFLCEPGQGQAVARAFTQKLNLADREARKAMHGGLIVAGGNGSGLRKEGR